MIASKLRRPDGEPEKNFDVLSGIEPGASL
jgi:hypothetical protein